MDFNNFSSESNSIFVIQESSTNDEEDDDGIKPHDFEICDEKSIIQINSDDEFKEIDNKMINTSKSMNNSSVGVDHDYGSVTKDVDITLSDYIINNEGISVSGDKSSDITDDVENGNTFGENFICIKEEQYHISTSNESMDSHDNTSLSSTNVNQDTLEKVSSPVICDEVQDIEENSDKKILSSVSEETSEPAKKHFKPICITGVKSLKITKNDMNIDKSMQNFNFQFHKSEDSNSSSSVYDRSEVCTFETEMSSNNSLHMKKKHAFASGKSSRKKINRLWRNFSKSKLGKVTCKVCSKTILYRHSNSALLRHLRFAHLYIYNQHIDYSFKNTRGYEKRTKIQNSSNMSEDVSLDPSSLLSIVLSESSGDKRTCTIRRLSESWKYFTQITTDRIRCNICDTTLKFVDGVSSNLTRHLRRRHFDIYSTFSPTLMKLDHVTCEPTSERYQNKSKKINTLHHKQRRLMIASGENVSKIQKYFTKFSSNKVRCITCYRLLQYTHGSTLNLKNHIIVKHKDIFERIVASICNSYATFETIVDGERKNKKIELFWKYFTSMKSGKLKCNLCTDLPFYCDVADSFQHLHLKHKIICNDFAEQCLKRTGEDGTSEENEISVKNVGDTPENFVKDFEGSDNEKSNENIATDKIWKYFTKIFHDKTIEVTCNLCFDIFSYTHGMTKNLIYHLNLVHKNYLSYCETDHGLLLPEQAFEDTENENKLKKNRSDLNSTAAKTGSSKSRSKASKTWKYFTLVGQFKAKCNICSSELSFQPRSNSNLSRHLKRKHKDVYDSESTSDKIEMNLNQSQSITDKEFPIQTASPEMRRLYEFLKNDVKLKTLFVLDSSGLKCKICFKIFLDDDFNNCISILRQHMQINHAEWKIVCADDVSSCKRDSSTSSLYNELEAIANEVESYKENKDLLQTSGKSELAEMSSFGELDDSLNETYKNVWKYFTKLTSTNVRCNFCSILLAYKSNKKWNLYRHLHLKHISKLENDDVEALEKIHGTNRPKNTNKNSPKKSKFNSGIKKKSPRKKNIHSDKSLRRSDSSMRNSRNASNLGKYWSVKSESLNRIGRTWSHFTKVDMGKATCNICHKTLRYLGNGSDVLNKHLNKNHLNKTLKSAKSKLSLASSSASCDGSGKNNKILPEKKKEPRKDKKLNSEEIESAVLNDSGQENDESSESESDNNDLDYIYNNSEFSSSEEEVEEEEQERSKSARNAYEKGKKSTSKKKFNGRASNSSTPEKFCNETILQSRSNVWTYYTNLEDGFAKCHLCLSQITYKNRLVNLINHLQKIHSVVSLFNPTTECSDSNYEDKKGKSQLLAAIDLTPNTSKENTKQICFTKLNESIVRCNFCSHLLSYKKNNINELNCHLQNCREIKDYNNLLLNSFTFFENGDDLSKPVLVNDAELSTYNQSASSNNLSDQNNVPNLKGSNTWLYYTKLNNSIAQCNICSKELSFKNGSVYNLNRHLSVIHNIKLHRQKSSSKPEKYSEDTRMPKIFKICKRKSSTLSFYSKVNRYVVKCKLCCKRFTYKGVNINRLINHLWSAHIARLIEFNSESIPSVSEPMTVSDDEENEKNYSVLTVTGCTSSGLKTVNKSTAGGINKPESGRKFSHTWKYFTKKSDKDCKAICNICTKYFSYKNGNVSNLSRHLLRNHGIKLIKATPSLKEAEAEASKTEKKNTDDNNISITNEGLLINTSLNEIYTKNVKISKPGKAAVTDVCKNECDETNSISEKGNDDEIWKYFKKVSEDEVECITCNEKITLEEGNVSNLQNHLFSVHKIKVVSFVHPLSVVASKDDDTEIVEKVNNIVNEHVDNYCRIKNINKKLEKSISKMKCKLCYKYVVFTGNKSDKWVNHLSDHEKELSVDENLLLLELKNNKGDTSSKENDTDVMNGNKTSDYTGEMLVYKYFKNLKMFKRKCKICGKFISSKIHCSHRVPNDISVTYGINRNRFKVTTASATVDKLDKLKKSSLNVDEDNNNSQVSCKTECVKSSCGVKNVIHFMNINTFENKCGLCCMSSINQGYCSHSLNQWWIESQQWWIESQQKKSDDLKDHVKVEDELEIITDALSDGENKIIIITDDGASSVLNYDDAHKNRSMKDDVACQVVNAEGENSDDIQVIIYNFNPDESGNSYDETSENIKIGEIQGDSGGSIQPCNKELEEQVKVILRELNNANSFINQTKGSEMLKCDKNHTDSEKLSASKSSDSAEAHQLPSRLNKTEVNCLDEAVSEIEREDLSNLKNSVDYVVQSSNTSDKSNQESSLSSTQCSKTIVEPVNPPYEWLTKTDKSVVEFTDVINDIEGNFKALEQSEQNELKGVQISHESTLAANEIEQNSDVFDEANVNRGEPPEQCSNFDSNMFANDGFDIKSGMVLQKLKSFMINKNLIYFSKINYKYKSAKCNLCSSYLFFKKPVIYHLLTHLFSKHENRIMSCEAPLDITYDKNGKKILDLDSYESVIDCSDIKPRKKCPVWKFFINDSNCRATCKICRFNFSYKGGAVNNLGRHLRLRHNIFVSTRNATDDSVENYNEDVINYLKDYPTLPKRRTTVKLRSKTWNYFTKEPNDWAKCILCKKYLSYRSSTINNLRRHLRTVHANIYHSLFLENDNALLKDEFTGQSELMNDETYKNLLLDNPPSKSRDEVLQECSYTSSERSGTKRKSVVWNYFTEECRDSGRCNFCLKLISCKGGGTSNLSRHLRVKHGIWIVMTSTLSEKYEEEFTNVNESNETVDPSLNQSNDVSQSQIDTIITHEQLHILKKRKVMNRRSKTWEFFAKESSDRVVCKICSKTLSYKCKAVHNLRRHLAIKHPNHISKRDPPRIKLQISNENGSIDSEGQNHSVDTDKTYIDITDTSVVIVDEENTPPVRKGDRVTRPKKSYAWNYFDEIEYGIAKCTMCGKILSFRGGGTNNLMRHLRSRHSMFIDVQLSDNTTLTTAGEVVPMPETENLDAENNFVLINENSM